MKLHGQLLALATSVSLATQAFAFLPSTNPPLANFDNRNVRAIQESTLPTEQAAAVSELRVRVPNLKVDFEPVTGAPRRILNHDGFLSGPGGSGRGISAASLTAIPTNDPNRVTKAFLREHSRLFGHGPEALDQARVKHEFVTPHNGMRTVVWEQQVDDVPVFEALLISHTTQRGELVNIGSQFIANPQQAADRGAGNRAALLATPGISAQQAVTIAARNVGEEADINLVISRGAPAANPEKNEKFAANFLVGEASAKLIWLPTDNETLRLCWDVTLTSRKRGEMFRVLVDAQTAVIQVRHCLTDYLSDASYRVFTSDSPSPFSPGFSTPVSTQPPLVSRSLVTLPALNTNASPAGWINDGGNETLGNNVDAHTDTNNDDLPDLPRPQGSPFRVFDFAMDLTTQNPSAYRPAAVVQLFYWNNFMHDRLYELGFTEAAGNFQSNNFGRGGLGNDAVQADAQDGGGFNNANFSTPSDGSPGRMQMYVFNGPTPQRDGDFDAEIVLHEYTHGLSNRRVGGGVGISALQSGGMGEGWSDFYGLALLSEAGDDVNGVYAAGAYATYQLSGLTQNYYYGIRRYPYCTDMSKNPLTFKDIDPSQASAHAGIPRSSIIGTTANEVHNMGEVWCVTLWEARANLINKYGWAAGNQLMLQLVTDGMNLSPANPNFLQARDAIIQADVVDTGGANRGELWTAFAKRGMGMSATSPGSSTTSGLVEAFDVPDNLQINPSGLSSSGPVGGPFIPNPAFFSLTNNGVNTLTWRLANNSSWLTLSPSNGTLIAGGASATVTVTIGATATNFLLGTTNAIIWFTNQSSGIAQSRTFSLSVVGRSLFEDFEPGIHLSLWSGFGGTIGSTVIATNYGGSVSGVNSLWLGDAGTRSATTIPINTSAGGSISFYLRLGNGSFPWETVDIPGEGIVLECSTNSGVSWTLMGTYDTSTFYNWTQVTTSLPAGSVSPATQFRWRQLSHSGTCCDHWALDDISIDAGPTPPTILVQPASQSVRSGSNVTFTVSAQGSFPLIYQWRKNTTNLSNGGRITGATNATLSISTLVESDGGLYSVLVTNIYGPATSSNATLLVTPLDHFGWSAISSPQAVGVAFNTTITAKDFLNATVTNFNGTVALSGSASGGGQTTNTILGNLVPTTTTTGDYTLAFAFTPNTNIVVTHVRSYSGTKVSIWQTNGTLLASQNVSSVPGTWVETLLAAPLTLAAGSTYIVSFYTAAGSYYYRSDRTNSFPNGTLVNAYYYSVSDSFPSNIYNADQVIFLVDLRYTVNAGGVVSVTPASAGPFTNGVWTGSLTMQQPATNAVVRADDGSGHAGTSNPFDVLLQNDVSIAVADSPDPVSLGGNLTYTLTVANAGPLVATSVVVTNFLPPGITFISASSSQGSCSQSAGVVTCNLGTLPGANNATISIVVIPNVGGLLTNNAVVSRGEADSYLANNSVTAVTLAQVPAISINDCNVLEGNFGTANAIFPVSLSFASALPVAVNYATADGTAFAGPDYNSTNATLTFAPGETNKTIVVVIKSDTVGEANETFFVNLSNPTNASLADAQGLGTILNDDVPPAAYLRSTVGAPWSSTSNETAMGRVFGASNWQDLRYETVNVGVLLSPATTFIYLEGSDNNATELETFLTANIVAVQNWVSNGGSLFLNAAPNEDNGMSFGFGVTLVYSDPTATGAAAVPAHPIFNGPFTPVGAAWSGNSFGHATVTGAGLATLITNTVNGHIVLGEMSYGAGHVLFGGMTTDNFHTPQPEASNLRANIIAYLNASSAYHFEWSALASPQQLNVPFPITITAKDVTNGIVTGFNGAVSLSAIAGNSNLVSIAPTSSGNFTNGVWTGTITVQQPAVNVVLTANDGSGHSGSSAPFDVNVPNDISVTLNDSPDPVSVGASLTYSLTITNTGPAAATAVMVTNLLPASVTFISATASQGTCTQAAGIVTCNLGSVPGGASATVTIIVTPTVAGTTITNQASVSRAEIDPYLGNNSAMAATIVTTPAISIADASVAESNVGTTNLIFAVTLAAPSAQTITVNYATADVTASASSDYVGTSGLVTFPPGTTNGTIAVSVFGDTLIESNETFAVNLSSPVNGSLGRSQGVGTIINDDGLPGQVDHFSWNVISSPQAVAQPFGITITAKDIFNGTATNFTGSVSLRTGSGISSILLFENVNSHYFQTALNQLGVSYQAFNSGTEPAFNAAIASANRNSTLVILDAASTFNDFTAITAYVNGGGRAIFEFWDLDMQPTVASAFKASVAADMFTPQPVYDWGGSQLFAGLPNPIVFIETTWGDDGDFLNATSGGVAVAGFTSSPASSQAAVIIGNSGRTILNGFLLDDAQSGSNAVRLAQNEIQTILGSSLSANISPTNSGTFSNGVWVGSLAVLQAGTNITIVADDGDGHTGESNPFNVFLQNDISISITDSPDPVSVGANLTYTLTVANAGPATATSVVVTNVLPTSVAFVSAAASQGTSTQAAGIVTCNLGSIPGGTNVTVTIIATPTIAGLTITNVANVSRGESDPFLPNNSAIATTVVTPPAISISDASVVEGNVGITNALFSVTIPSPSAQTITVNYSTANGTAFAGSDYNSTNGLLTFMPGATNASIQVVVNGDILIESNETFVVNLSNPINGILARSQGTGTITNDDGFAGEIYSLNWSTISSPQYVNQPFISTITAKDAVSNLVSSFNGTVAISGSASVPVFSVNFTNGIWTGNVIAQLPATNLVLRADDGNGHIGLSNPFHVTTTNQAPVVVGQPTNTSGYLGGAASFQVNVYGTEPFFYQWRLNGANISGATNSILTLTRILLEQAGSYSVIVSNAFGGTSSGKATLSIIQVVAWGAGTNNNGLNFNYNQSVVPVGLTNAVGISGGLYHSLAVKADGKVSAWGAGTNNTQQNPNYGQSIVPLIGNVIAVAGGGYHTLALRSDGTVAAWGAGTNNILQTPFTGQSIVPLNASNVTAIAAGDYHSVALRSDGRVLVWGYNGFGQTNVPAAATSNVVAIASRGSHVLALRSDGVLVHWGNLTTLPFGATNLVTIAAGINHCLALKNDGTVISWGSQTVVPFGLSNVVDIAAGADQNLALRSDGTVVTWGATNLYGRQLIPPGISNFIGVACGSYHSMAFLGTGSPLIKWQPTSRATLLGTPAFFSVLAVGQQLRYQWQFNGTNILNATNFSYTVGGLQGGVQALNAGNYRAVISNAFGVVTSSVVNLTVLAQIGPAVDSPNLTWSTSGNAAWFGETTVTHDGVDAAQSGLILDGQQSTVQTTVAGPGVLNFWWKVSSEQFFDYLNFFVDAAQQTNITGEVDWQSQTFAIGLGTHTVKWTYQKDSSVSAGLDAGWLDQVLYTTNPPVITLQPVGQTNSMGATFALVASASGAPPLTYQWIKAGTNVGGAVSSAFNISNATRHDSAVYSVVAKNPGGSTASSNAVVLIRVPQQLRTLLLPDGTFVLISGDADGGLLLPGDLGNFEPQVSSNLFDWTPLTNNLVLTNGTLLLVDPDSTNYTSRFYRIIEH